VIGLLGRLILSMGVVLGVMVLAAKVVRNRNFAGLRRGGPTTRIEVLARQPFGKNASVAVVMAAGKALVIGVTESNVTVLAEADPEALQTEPVTPDAGSASGTTARPMAQWTGQPGGDRPALTWKTWIEQLRERTLRR
jgi:flagellar protein FliO/FliZ